MGDPGPNSSLDGGGLSFLGCPCSLKDPFTGTLDFWKTSLSDCFQWEPPNFLLPTPIGHDVWKSSSCSGTTEARC